jgi:hypothetical protein
MNFKLTDRYKHKIKTPLEIKEIIGEIPRDRKVTVWKNAMEMHSKLKAIFHHSPPPSLCV